MSRSVTVFGLGALGSNLAVQLVRQFPDFNYVGVDFDSVEERNLRTQAYFVEHVGLLKTAALRATMLRHARKVRYVAVNRKIEHPPLRSPDEVWVDCFDNAASRRLLTPANLDAPILHVGFSPLYSAEIIWNHAYDVPNDVDPARADICSLPDAAAFIGFVVNLAALNLSDYFLHGVQRNLIVTNRTNITYL